MGSQEDRLVFAVRRNRRRLMLAQYASELEERLGRSLPISDILDLSDTDPLWDALRRQLGELLDGRTGGFSDYLAVDTSREDEAREFFRRALSFLASEPHLFLFITDSEDLGAVRVTLNDVWHRAALLSEPDEVPARVVGCNAEVGVEFYVDTISGHAPPRWTVIAWAAR